MLSKKEKRIFHEFVARVRIRWPAARIWAFGSRSRGDAVRDSNLDICVVANDIDDEFEVDVMEIAHQLGLEHEVIITTVTYSQTEFDRVPLSEDGLINYILTSGIAG